MKFQKYITEKQIIVGGGAKYGQVVFLAGGAGSGKGFSTSNFMEMAKFKIRDIDKFKLAVRDLAILKKDNPEIANTNMKNPKDVSKLHQYVKDKGWKNATLELLLKDVSSDHLPNIIFDITLKDEKNINKILPALFDVGYQKTNIHLVWVLTDYQIAVVQNKTRERIVSDEIMLATHTGAALTMTDMMNGKIETVGKEIDGSIHVILGGSKHTVHVTTMDTKETLKGKNKFVQLGGETVYSKSKYPIIKDRKEDYKGELVIKSFKYITIKHQGKPMRKVNDFVHDVNKWADLKKWVVDNIPKTTNTRNIRRRARM